MTKIRLWLAGLLLASLFTVAALAQTGQLGSGQIWGNPNGSQQVAQPASMSQMFDRAFCSTVGYVVARTTGGWVCSSAIPAPVTWFGAVCDGATDDAVILQSTLNTLAGKVLYVPAGYTCATSAVLTMPADNTAVIGAGRDVSGFKSLITNRGAIFYMNNRQGITISDLNLQGTRTVTSWTLASMGAIDVEQDVNAAAAKSGFTFRNLKLSGFNSTYWIQISLGNSTFDMNNVTLDNIVFDTATADIPTDPTPSNNQNYAIAIYGGSTGPRVAYTSVRNLTINGAALCYGVGFYNTHYGFNVINNKILNVGATNTVAHCTNGLGFTNSYGMFVYDIAGAGFPSSGGLIQGNYILNPYSAGIYTVGENSATLASNDFNTLISDNEIVGQSQSDLPIRGAIVVNNYTNTAVVGNKLYNNWAGVVASGQYVGQLDIKSNTCSTNVSGGSCISLAGASGTTGNVPEHSIVGNTLQTSGTSSQTLKLTNDNTHYLGGINFSENKVVAAVTGVNFSGLFINSRLVVRNNTFSGVASTSMLDASSVTGGPVVAANNVFDLAASTTGLGMKVDSSLAYVAGALFMNRNSGSAFAYSGVSATGTVSGVQFSNVATANQVVASSLGLAKPTWSAAAQDFVQNVAVGSGAVQTLGWINPSNGNNWIAVDSISALTSAHLFVGNASNVPADVALSGDCALANTGAITCTKTNGASFGGLATVTPGSGVAGAAANPLSGASGLTSTIASGTAALGTSAIASAACASVVTVAAANTATTDVVSASFNGDPSAVTGYVPSVSGMLTIFIYPTSGNVNFKVCNNTASSITPGAITLNWRVTR